MKDLQNSFISSNETNLSEYTFNKVYLMKYLIMFIVITISTLVIPTCGVLKSQAVFIGIIAATTFAVIDMNIPNNVYVNGFGY